MNNFKLDIAKTYCLVKTRNGGLNGNNWHIFNVCLGMLFPIFSDMLSLREHLNQRQARLLQVSDMSSLSLKKEKGKNKSKNHVKNY